MIDFASQPFCWSSLWRCCSQFDEVNEALDGLVRVTVSVKMEDTCEGVVLLMAQDANPESHNPFHCLIVGAEVAQG